MLCYMVSSCTRETGKTAVTHCKYILCLTHAMLEFEFKLILAITNKSPIHYD